MLFAGRVQDYQVTGLFRDSEGRSVCEERICHNMSKKEAKMDMQMYILRAYSNAIDLDRPIKISCQPVTKSRVAEY
ncbi:hypothetical protein [Schleiferilactobacillus shenzhenensis]|nr:hypothetical protein [Schleiferilactobacillus shenzhenensis]